MSEEWRTINKFPHYAVSSEGRVRRIKPDLHGRMNCEFLKPILGNHGYLMVTLHHDGNQVTRLVHRLVCAAFHADPPTRRHQAAHENGDRSDNRQSNLRWATPSENNLDKNAHGTMRVGSNHHAIYRPECMPRGSSHGNAKLTEEVVIKIRADTRSQSKIARDLGVSQSLISQVKRRKVWAHI